MYEKMMKNIFLKRAIFIILAFIVLAGTLFPAMAMAETMESDSSSDSGYTADMNVKMPQIEEIQLEGDSEEAKEALTSIDENNGIVLFAEDGGGLNVPAADTDEVVFSYNKIVNYENWFTRQFSVTYDGKTRLAYCVEPHQDPPDEGTQKTVKYDNALMAKALYYSYGYPGYDNVTKAYLSKQRLDNDYHGNDGAYAFSHLMLSYIYDGESGASDALGDVGADTKTLLKNFVYELKNNWPDIPDDAGLALNTSSVHAEWNPEKQRQETPVIKLKGSSNNKITVKVPEGTTVFKVSDNKMTEHIADMAYNGEVSTPVTVDIYGGDEFYFTAQKSVTGRYDSGKLTGSMEEFQPYLINVSKRQDIMYCGDGSKDSVSFSIEWDDLGKFVLNKVSASPEITDGSSDYSLDGARYEILDETGEKYEEIETDIKGDAEVTLPYGEYILKEKAAPKGYIVDSEEHKIIINGSETVMEHKENIVPVIEKEKTVEVPDIEKQPENIPVQNASPQTGDEGFNVMLLGVIAGIAALAMVILVFWKSRSKE